MTDHFELQRMTDKELSMLLAIRSLGRGMPRLTASLSRLEAQLFAHREAMRSLFPRSPHDGQDAVDA